MTLFSTGEARTRATLHATFARGYREDPENWPWELCELINLSAAVERAAAFDVIHYQAKYHPLSLPFGRLAGVPLVVTLHHAPAANEVALWARHYPDAPFVAVSEAQHRAMSVGRLSIRPSSRRWTPLRACRSDSAFSRWCCSACRSCRSTR